MAMSKKCDRCGIFYDHYSARNKQETYNAVAKLYIDKFGDVKAQDDHIDLCPDCMEKLERFLRNAGDVI